MSQSVSKVREAKLELYRKQGKIHAKQVDGRFNRLRWLMVWLTQIVFYGGCWLTWDSQGVVRQAILLDIAHERLYLFGLVLWPQDALLLAFMLILGATLLFLVTALAGRLFCGFACPQTVYTQIFTWIEAKVEGDHLDRLRLDQGPLTGRKLWLKGIKHGLWIVFASWTAISFVGYFTPIRELLPSIAVFQTGPWESFWLIFYALFTYVQAGLAREAVCQHMCPYSRFQGVMIDAATSNVAYDRARGEPRRERHQSGASGDCVDCGICVQVCPTGIDIRNGLQHQCINCGLCIDACDQVMDKVNKPRGLIRFASETELQLQPRQGSRWRRPRVAIYLGLSLLFAGLSVGLLSQRSLLLVDVLRDRGALLRENAVGEIENSYTLQLSNLDDRQRQFRVSVAGLAGLRVLGNDRFTVAPGGIQSIALTLARPNTGAPSGVQPILFRVEPLHDPAMRASEKSTFILP